MAIRTIRLELARTPEFPEGSSTRGYEFKAPLDDQHHLDPAEWQQHKRDCTVRRFWAGEEDEHGNLIHTRHRTWAFSYAPGEDDDEPVFRLESHMLREGEYLSITEHDGSTLPFRIVSVL